MFEEIEKLQRCASQLNSVVARLHDGIESGHQFTPQVIERICNTMIIKLLEVSHAREKRHTH